jgi:hypothetical protein
MLDEFVENPEKFYKRRDETNKIRRSFRIHLRIFSKYGKKNRPGRCFSWSIAFKKPSKVAHFYQYTLVCTEVFRKRNISK